MRRLTPTPSTLDLQDVRKANAVRERLTLALHTGETLPKLREQIVHLLCDMTQANRLEPTAEELCAETWRSHPEWVEAEQAPATDRNSPEGREFGVEPCTGEWPV